MHVPPRRRRPRPRIDAATRRPLPSYTHHRGSPFNATRFSNPNLSTPAQICSERSRRRTGGHHHGVVNSQGDNGIEIDPLVRNAAAGMPAVT